MTESQPTIEKGMTEQCIFCEIISGTARAAIIHENEEYVAFMDRYPIAYGHSLVVPKKHYATLFDMSGPESAKMFSLAIDLARAVKATLKPEGLIVALNAGSAASQQVFHAHVHVLPRYADGPPQGLWLTRMFTTTRELMKVATIIGAGFTTPSSEPSEASP